MDVVMVANSPGEIAGWVAPVVARLKARSRELRAFLFIPPCPFAAGTEKEVAKDIFGLDLVISPKGYLLYTIFKRRPRDFNPSEKGVVVHLGGDFFHSAFLSRRLKFPAIAYTDRSCGFVDSFQLFLAEDERVAEKISRKGAPPSKIVVVGSLMADAVQLGLERESALSGSELQRFERAQLRICLLPGSRPQQVRYMTPFFLKVAEIIKKVEGGAEFSLILSPFATLEALRDSVEGARKSRFIEGTCGRLTTEDGHTLITTGEGLSVSIVTERRYTAMSISDLALVMPGTAASELGFLGVPMVVAVPLNRPSEIPLPGLVGLLGGLPIAGGVIKGYAVRRLPGKIEFAAMPNKKARRHIVPEVWGVLRPEDIAIKALELLQDTPRREAMSRDLRESMGAGGTADRVVDAIFQIAAGS